MAAHSRAAAPAMISVGGGQETWVPVAFASGVTVAERLEHLTTGPYVLLLSCAVSVGMVVLRRYRRSRSAAVLALLLGALLPSSAEVVRASDADARVARGRYLANGIARCFWCHSPLDDRDPATPRPESLGAGDVLDEKTPIVAPNITPDAETGLGRWSDAEVIRAIREGVGREGRWLRSDHPYAYYSVMTDEDALAIVSYLRSLPPVHRPLRRSAPVLRRHVTVQPATPPARSSSLRSAVDRGRYLVQLGECLGCHTTTTREDRPFRGMEFGGGRRFRVEKGVGIEFTPDVSFTLAARRGGPGEAGLVTSANITPDPSGIAFYTEDVFRQTLRTGRVGGIRPLSSAMPWVFFKALSDEDLGAIFAYLRTLPPVRHRVSNFDPPTFCALCGRRHGLGELNRPVDQVHPVGAQ